MTERRHRPPIVVRPLDYPKWQLPPRRPPPVDLPMPTMRPPAYFVMRVSRLGPLLPARLWWCDHAPDEPDNKLDRGRLSIYPRAEIAGAEVEPERLFDRLMSPTDPRPAHPPTHWKYAQPINEAQYRFEADRIRWAARHRPDDPALRRQIEPAQLPLPSFEPERAL